MRSNRDLLKEMKSRFVYLRNSTRGFFKCLPRAGAQLFAFQSHFCAKVLVALSLAVLQIGSTARANPRTIAMPVGSQPKSITKDADGNFWITLSCSSGIARISREGIVTLFITPTPSNPAGITAGPDGNIWFTEGATGKIGVITPAGDITEIKFSSADTAAGITAGSDGDIWFCDESGNNIWRFDISSQELTKFPLPTANASPGEITAGCDRNLWFTERSVNKIGRITPTGTITEISNLSSPGSITTGADHNIWFASNLLPVVGRITATGSVTLFPTPSVPYQIRPGEGSDLLFTEPKSNKIATITSDGKVSESYTIPFGAPTGITAGSGRAVWFLGSGDNRVYSDIAPESGPTNQTRTPSVPAPPSGLHITVTGT